VVLIGLYAVIVALTALPARLVAVWLWPKVFEGTATFTDLVQVDPVVLSTGPRIALLLCLSALVPGVVTILARRRISMWLLPTPESVDNRVGGRDLLWIGLVLLGIHRVIAGIVSASTVLSTPSLVIGLEKVRWSYRLLSPAVSVMCGMLLLAGARWMTRQFAGPPSSDEGA